MAQRVRVDLVDDVDGSPAEESVNFALDGVNYVICLLYTSPSPRDS